MLLDMSKRKKEREREERIAAEAIVDAYGPEEQAMGWYYYLEDRIRFPFTAVCTGGRAISPLRKGDQAEVIGMAPEDECRHEMFVSLPFGSDRLAVPLSQLAPIGATDEDTVEAIEDWHYWVAMGYTFG